jgi:hypothetical protein
MSLPCRTAICLVADRCAPLRHEGGLIVTFAVLITAKPA